MKRLLLSGLLGLSLSSCSSLSTVNGLSVNDYAKLSNGAPIQARRFKITCRLVTYDGSNSGDGSLVVGKLENAVIGKAVDWVVPTKYELAKVQPTTTGAWTIEHPARPIRFNKVQVGRVLNLKVDTQGPFVEVHGVLTTRTGNNNGRSFGDASLPLLNSSRQVISENALLISEFITQESYVHLIGSPGKEHLVDLPDQNAQLYIQVDPVQ